MAYVAKGRGAKWELRVARSTPDGPRSKTIATFDELTDDLIAAAEARTGEAIDRDQIERAARRAGAPVRLPAGERAARELLSAIDRGEQLRPGLARLLAAAIGGGGPSGGPSGRPSGRPGNRPTDGPRNRPTDAAIAASAWAGRSNADRAAALFDLLLLADAIPARRRSDDCAFPRITRAAT